MTNGVSADQLARTIGLALAGRRAWVAPEVATLAATPQTPDPPYEVAVIAATQLSEGGEVRGPRAPAEAIQVWAVLGTPVQIVRRCVAPVAQVALAFSPFGVFEVTAAGLVIVQLAPGVAATDVQAMAEPTLKISSRVDLMRDSVPPHRLPR